MQMFTVSVFIIAKEQKQLKCMPVGKWIDKTWFIYTGEYYAAIKEMKYRFMLQHDEPRKHDAK